jgi:hypothetical protein
VPAAVVDGLGDEPHEPDAPAAVHQVYTSGHLPFSSTPLQFSRLTGELYATVNEFVAEASEVHAA